MATNNAINTTSGKITLEKAASDLQTTYIGGTTWSTGQDNTDNSFRISQNATLGTNDTFVMSSAGEKTLPLQPSFLARLSTTQNNVTGDGTYYDVINDTEIIDRNSDYNNVTGIFIAPITGVYLLKACCRCDDLIAAHTTGQIRLTTSNRTYYENMRNASIRNASNQATLSLMVLTDMDAGDTAIIAVYWSGSTKIVDVYAHATNVNTWFSGFLVC